MYTTTLGSGDWFADIAQLHDRLDDMLRGGTASSIRSVGRAGAFPALNVGTWADAFEIYAFAPGVDPASLEVTVEKGLLTIAGERKETPPTAQERRDVYAHERFAGRFRRVVALAEDADPARVEASYRDGVLKIVVHKRESSKPRQIRIADGR